MPIHIRDTQIRQLVEQMTSGGKKIDEVGVQTLIDAAYANDGRLSSVEQQSLQSLLSTNSDLFESSSARDKLQNFNRMSNAALRDASHRFASDGRICDSDARELKDIALRDGRVSQREKVTLKALLGFYAPTMEPGAQNLIADLAGVSAPSTPTTPNTPTTPTEPRPSSVVLGSGDKFQTYLDPTGVLSTADNRPPANIQETSKALYNGANLIDKMPPEQNLFADLPLEQKQKLFEQLRDSLRIGQEGSPELEAKDSLQLRSSATTNLLHLIESLPTAQSDAAELKSQAEEFYVSATKAETNPMLRDSMIYNMERAADSLLPTTRTETKKLYSAEIAPTSPPYDEWFKDGNKTINISWMPGQGSEGFYRGTVEMLKNKGFQPEGQEREGGPVVYTKTIRNQEGVETIFRIQVKEYNNDLFSKMNDPNFQIIGYDGHSDIGRAMRRSLDRAPQSDDKKLIFYGLCAGKDNISRVRDKYPDAQIMTTHNSSYFRTSKDSDGKQRMVESENFNALMQTIEGVAERKDWTGIRKDIQTKAIPSYWRHYHPLPGGMNYITPIDTAILRKSMDSDRDGQVDALDRLVNFNITPIKENTRTEFQAIDPGLPADQIDGTNIHTAANALNTAVNYNSLTSKYNNIARVLGGGYFEGSPEDPIVRYERTEFNGETTWLLNVNKNYAHISEEALRAVAMFEWNEQIYSENPNLYETRWRDVMPWNHRERPEPGDRTLMGLTLATFTLAYDMKESPWGPNARDTEIWNNLLTHYNLPSELSYRPIYKLIDEEKHDYAGSPTVVHNWKKEIPPDILSQIK